MSNLSTLTTQEVYDIVKNHLLAQGKPALDRNDACAYRGAKGTSCAVGCLIPNEEYKRKMEGETVDSLLHKAGPLGLSEELIAFLDKHQDLLGELQGVHDEGNPDRWPENLAFVAEKFNLVP